MELKQLNLKDGELIFITANGSIEHSIHIWNESGTLRIEGPMNCNHKAILVKSDMVFTEDTKI